MSDHLGPLAFALGAYLVVPIVLARFVVGASWLQIVIAYGILLLGLGLVAAGGRNMDEKVGWMLILGIFCTAPGVPILSLILRRIGVGA